MFDVTTSGQVTTSSEELDNTISQEATYPGNEDDVDAANKYCKCSSDECNCCRDFRLPIVPVSGPGCASIKYLGGDRMSVGIKFGNRVLANRVISGMEYLQGLLLFLKISNGFLENLLKFSQNYEISF